MLKNKIEEFLNEYSIRKTTVLIAFSGGFDSMCLLDIISQLKEKFQLYPIAIHLNHNWRGNESKQEEENCLHFCNKHNIEFYSETLPRNVKQTETVAREARYEFFRRCAEKFDTKFVFTAHNADDNAETLIYRIAKGTGIDGLKGISQKREIFYRPLINTYRQEIETYCKARKLSPNSDSSNNNTQYKRNFIRKKIIPELEKINKDAKIAINNLCANARTDNEIIKEYINSLENKFKTSNFVTYSTALKNRIIYEFLTENNFEYDKKTIENIVNFINKNYDSKNGKTMSLNCDSFLFVNHNEIRLIQNNDTLKYKLIIEKCTVKPSKFPPDSEGVAYVDLSLTGENFEWRNRNDGDFIHPLGLKGKQKLKKYLNEKGVPKDKRDKMLFLCQGTEVFWAPTLGISEKIKVKNNPTHILKLEKIYED